MEELIRQLPHEDIIFLADTARVPYGSRSADEIIKINQEIIPFLIKQGAKLIIMACGTSSAIAYPVVKDDYPVEIINLIDPGAQAAVSVSRSGRIGLIATVATVNSEAYQNKIKKFKPDAVVFAVGCPLFVPLVENGQIDNDETKTVAKEYLKPLIKEKIDTLILGCTHYPHLVKVIKEIVGPNVALVNPAEAAVAETKQWLKQAKTLRNSNTPGKHVYYVTGSEPQFTEIGSRLLGRPIVGAKQISLS